MSKVDDKNKNNKVAKKDQNLKKGENEKRDYKNPVETKWGKAIIWFLIFGMAGIVIVSTIWVIVDALIK